MSKREFIDKLRSEISKLPKEEIDAAVEFFEEYFDEAGSENEKNVLEELGSPKKVAGQIKAEYAVRTFDEEEKPTMKKGLSTVWYVILGICSAPVSIPIAAALGAVVIAVIAALIAVIVSIFAGILACITAGIACIVIGIMAAPVAMSTAMLFVGGGIVILAVMAALGALMVIGMKAAIGFIIKTFRKKSKRKHLEKTAGMNSRSKWIYREEMTETGGKRHE